MSKQINQFQLSHKLSKELQREAEYLHMTLEDYVTDILIDRHKLQQFKQLKTMEVLIEEVKTLVKTNRPKSFPSDKSLLGLMQIGVVNKLKQNNISTVGDLQQMRYSDLKALRNIGPKTLKIVDEFMIKHNISFRGFHAETN